MKLSTASRLVSVGAVVAIVSTGAPAVASSSGAHPVKSLVGLIDAIPSWAVGVVPRVLEPATAPVQITLALKGRDEAGLEQFVAAVSNPASPSYRHFLTKAQYEQRFAPAASEVTAARAWLRKAGFTIDGTTAARGLITAHAASSVVAGLFDTTFGLFNVAGQLLRAPLSEPTMPTGLRAITSTVIGLAQNPAVSNASPAPAFINARPCSHYYGQKMATKQPKYDGKHQAYAICGYTVGQVRSAYGLNKVGLTGKGATVGVVDAFASPTITQDVNEWSSQQGIPGLDPGQLDQVTLPGMSSLPEVNIVLPILDGQGWQEEESLDVEAVHGIAPGAKIIYYSALNGFGLNVGPFEVGLEPLIVALGQAVESDKVQVVSNSWGGANDSPTPGDDAILNVITNEAAAEGITVDFSSGDAGDQVASSGKRSADFPATSPGVTAVGGTTLEVGKHGQRIGENYWGTLKAPVKKGTWDIKGKIFNGAGGGGVSTAYAEPSWQQGIVPNSEATYGGLARAGRVVPDVSMVADSTTGLAIGLTEHFADGTDHYGEFRIGGTSLSCPLFSALVALAVGKSGHGLGLINPTLYAKAGTAAGRQKLFNDPTAISRAHGESTLANVRPDYAATDNPKSPVSYTLRLLGNVGTLHARPGYDDSTGLGSPKGPALVAALS
ncbi:MAG TPA: S53 family peptidase [Mycobacteriales bacterium]|nr:S53 family peptidase [Mycobacteriales bacterium]